MANGIIEGEDGGVGVGVVVCRRANEQCFV